MAQLGMATAEELVVNIQPSVSEKFPEITQEMRDKYPSVTDESILENYPLLTLERLQACDDLADHFTKSEIREEERKSKRLANRIRSKIKGVFR